MPYPIVLAVRAFFFVDARLVPPHASARSSVSLYWSLSSLSSLSSSILLSSSSHFRCIFSKILGYFPSHVIRVKALPTSNQRGTQWSSAASPAASSSLITRPTYVAASRCVDIYDMRQHSCQFKDSTRSTADNLGRTLWPQDIARMVSVHEI